jgi:hypothetical protein
MAAIQEGSSIALDSLDVDTSGAAFVLDFGNKAERVFNGDTLIAAPAAISFTNDDLAKRLTFNFEIAAGIDLTFPVNTVMNQFKNPTWVNPVWTSIDAGEYTIELVYDDIADEWKVTVFEGPLT